jgi:hypothetical protein
MTENGGGLKRQPLLGFGPKAMTHKIIMILKDGTRYTLAPNGDVLDRSDGPAGFPYSDWRILGFLPRWNSGRAIPLADALTGADTGHGYVVDLDHGTGRVWASPNGHRLGVLSVEVV